jgi:hypothetical protein
MRWAELSSVTKVGIVLLIVTFLLTMNPLVTLIILLTHWIAHTYLFP